MTCIYEVKNAKEDTPCDVGTTEYKPLPSTVTDFIAESMCGILDTNQPPRSYSWDFVPLPELVLFVKKVTTKARIDVQTAIAALILVGRFKEGLPKNAHGEYGTTHKIFLSALLVATKEFNTKSHDEEEEEREGSYFCNSSTYCSPDELSSNPNLLDDSNSNYSSSHYSTISSDYQFDHHSHNILSTTPLSTTSSMISDDDVHEIMATTPHRIGYNNYKNRRNSIINEKLAEVSGIYSVQEVNQMEREFLKYLGHHNNWVSDKDIREFVENNKYALGIC